MAAYMIGYDLKNASSDRYDEIIDEIKTFKVVWHYLDSTWLIVTTLNVTEIRDKISPRLRKGDELLVFRLADNNPPRWAGSGLSKEASDWLNKHI